MIYAVVLAAVGALLVAEGIGIPVISTLGAAIGEFVGSLLSELGWQIGGGLVDAINPLNWL